LDTPSMTTSLPFNLSLPTSCRFNPCTRGYDPPQAS
jgi:hypothetical protein